MAIEGGGAGPLVLAVKVSNLETALGLFADGALLGSWSATTRVPSSADELEWCARTFLAARDLPAPEAAVLCTVVPALLGPWSTALEALAGRRPVVVGPGVKSGIRVTYKDPGQVGADRVALAVGAVGLAGAPVVVADFDAATSLSVVGEDGAFLGGTISAGLRVSLNALSGAAAQLPDVRLHVPKSVVGRTTADAIAAGTVLGEAARVDGLVDAIWDELGYETALLACGRHAQLVCSATRHAFEVCPNLPLLGLHAIWEINHR